MRPALAIRCTEIGIRPTPKIYLSRVYFKSRKNSHIATTTKEISLKLKETGSVQYRAHSQTI